ncbi:hypothetical protein HPB50_008022 [Hyalomma asiaticum]|uniref:Uncharacterized protein n=1 Tax=Hyalomma asiaticum TaxID=266040 RepID=A0ACB7SF83_HYAAI|nr:hypothetical protein HPB50_008022 [Hyalomma asiaticum]
MVDDVRVHNYLNEEGSEVCDPRPLHFPGHCRPPALDHSRANPEAMSPCQPARVGTVREAPEPTVSTSEPPFPHQLRIPGHRAGVHPPRSGHWTVGEASDSELQVVPARELKHGDDVYTMVRQPRGMCIIINNNFDGSDYQRDGSEHDVRRMQALFKAFHFNCVVHRDLKASDMRKTLMEAAQSKDHDGAECLVVILMSHGELDMIYGEDWQLLHLEDIYSLFGNKHCPALQGKPKVFFIQACRGDMRCKGTRTIGCQTDAIPLPAGLPKSSPSREEHMTTCSDIYVAYATIRGYVAFTSKTFGSWFLLSVYKVFSEHAGTMHLDMLMQLVRRDVMVHSTYSGSKQTPTSVTYGWTRMLYFNPGFTQSRAEEAGMFRVAV